MMLDIPHSPFDRGFLEKSRSEVLVETFSTWKAASSSVVGRDGRLHSGYTMILANQIRENADSVRCLACLLWVWFMILGFIFNSGSRHESLADFCWL